MSKQTSPVSELDDFEKRMDLRCRLILELNPKSAEDWKYFFKFERLAYKLLKEAMRTAFRSSRRTEGNERDRQRLP